MEVNYLFVHSQLEKRQDINVTYATCLFQDFSLFCGWYCVSLEMVMELEDLRLHRRTLKNCIIFELLKIGLTIVSCFVCGMFGWFSCPFFWNIFGAICFIPLLILNIFVWVFCVLLLLVLSINIVVVGLMTFGTGFVVLFPLLLIPIIAMLVVTGVSIPFFGGPVTGAACIPYGCLFGLFCELVPNLGLIYSLYKDGSYNHNIYIGLDDVGGDGAKRRLITNKSENGSLLHSGESDDNSRRSFSFLVESDIHFDEEIVKSKRNSVKKIINAAEEDPGIVALLVPGDLTHKGHDAKKFLFNRYQCGVVDEMGNCFQKYIEPIETRTKIKIFCGTGNHDEYVPWPYFHKPVRNFIVRRHGGLRYSFDIGDLHFICLGKYPDSKGIRFLKKDLVVRKSDQRIVIFFHFNLRGKWSNWWEEVEKETFYECIKDHQVALLVCGHAHVSQTREWRGMNVVLGAGSKIPKCTYFPDRGLKDCIEVRFL